jgi:hypothetical protein
MSLGGVFRHEGDHAIGEVNFVFDGFEGEQAKVDIIKEKETHCEYSKQLIKISEVVNGVNENTLHHVLHRDHHWAHKHVLQLH